MLPQVRVGDFLEVLADEDGPTEGQYLWVIQVSEIYQDVQVPPLPNLLLFQREVSGGKCFGGKKKGESGKKSVLAPRTIFKKFFKDGVHLCVRARLFRPCQLCVLVWLFLGLLLSTHSSEPLCATMEFCGAVPHPFFQFYPSLGSLRAFESWRAVWVRTKVLCVRRRNYSREVFWECTRELLLTKNCFSVCRGGGLGFASRIEIACDKSRLP